MTWPTVPLRRLVTCLDGRRVPLNSEQRAEMKGTVPYWGAGGVLDFVNQAIFNEPLILLKEDGSPFFIPEKGVAYYTEGPTWINNHIHALRATGANGRFLAYALNCVDYPNYLTGSTRDKLTQEDLKKIDVWQPPLEEQHRIASFLDAETACIEEISSLRKEQEANLAERSYATVSEILLPGILTSPSGYWPWPWLPAATRERPLVRLGYVCRLQNGLTVDGKRVVSGDTVTRPYLRVANVQEGGLALDTVSDITVPREIAARCALRSGDVLMTEGGDLDKLGRGTVWRGEIPGCLHQNHVFALRPELDRLDGNYLALMTRTLHGRSYFESTGTKTTNLASTNSSKILSFPIPLPNVSVQRDLAQQAQKALDAVAAASRLLRHQRSLLTERRQALITAAVTGQFDVSTASGRNVTDGV